MKTKFLKTVKTIKRNGIGSKDKACKGRTKVCCVGRTHCCLHLRGLGGPGSVMGRAQRTHAKRDLGPSKNLRKQQENMALL